ncbi:transposase [Paenibacillus rhizoplanae]|uniref:transposase n=1 Tax=Paenibacillus rhizoplanae TaxID=1917181 RepID=UPI0036136629
MNNENGTMKSLKQTVKFLQEQTKSFGELAEELDIPKSTLHQWMGQYRELKNEPVASVDRVRELEAELKEARRQLQERQDQLADREEELAILKKAVHIFSKPRNADSSS